jgi:hypothetical protein
VSGGESASFGTPRAATRAGDHGARASASLVVRAVRAPAGWLAVLVGLATIVRAGIAVRVPSPWILPDEILYSELAKSIASGHRPAVREVPVFGWGEVYPTLIAPAWALLGDPVHAYHAALGINALVMSMAAVPAYLLARLFVSPKASLVVAAMTVLVPSMAYTGVVMTENAFYPVFLLAVLLIARSVQRPTAGRQALALVGLGLVAFTRIQGLALVGAYLLAAAIYAATSASAERRAYVRRFAPTGVLLLVAPLAPLAASMTRGGGAFGWLGSRSSTFAEFHAGEVPEWFVYLTADLILYVAVVPVVATAIVVAQGLSRRASARVRLFAAVALPTLAAMLGSVSLVSASLDVDGTENLNERYVFYVVPLLFLGLALWIQQGLPRRRPWAMLVVAACCVLAVVLPVDRLGYNAGFQSVALLPWIGFALSPLGVALLIGAFTLACGALWLTCRADRVGRLWLVVGVWMVFVGALTVGSNARSASNSAHAYDGTRPTWVDDAVPARSRVAVLWDERLARHDGPENLYFWLTVTEEFNKSVGDVYRLGGPTYYEVFLPTVPVRSRSDRTVVDRAGRPLQAEYVLVTCRTPVAGTVVAEGSRGALSIVQVDGAVRLTGGRSCSRADS